MKICGKLFLSLAIIIGFFAFVSQTNAQTVNLSVDFNQTYFNTVPISPTWINDKPRAIDNNIAIAVSTNMTMLTYVAGMEFDLLIESPSNIVTANDSIIFDFYDKNGTNETDKMVRYVNLVGRVGNISTYHVIIAPVSGDLNNSRQGIGGSNYQKFFIVRLNLTTKMKVNEVLYVSLTNIKISDKTSYQLTNGYRGVGGGYPSISENTFSSALPYIQFTYQKTGDVNGDGVIDINDAIAGINHILGITIITNQANLDELDMTPVYGVYDIFDIVKILTQMTLNGGPGGIVAPPSGTTANNFYDVDGQIVIFQSSQPFALLTDLSGYKVSWNDDKTILGIDFGKNLKKTIELSAIGNVQVSVFSAKPSGVAEQDQAKLNLKVAPNPFNQKCQIYFTLEQTAQVKLAIYNPQGELVSSLLNQQMPQGQQNMVFDGANLSSGCYFYRLTIDGLTTSGKLNLIK